MTYTYDPTKGYTDPTTGKTIAQATATTTLSPAQQTLYDQNNQISTALNDQAIKGIGYVDQATSSPLTAGQFGNLTTGPAPATGYTNSVQTTPYQTNVAPSTFQTNVGVGNNLRTGVNAGAIKNTYDFSNVGAMPSSDDFGAQRDQVTNALMARLQPQIDQDRGALDAKLANQGISLGSSAYGTANQLQEQNVNDQRMSAVLAGSTEQQRLFNDAMGIRQQGVNEAEAQGNFWNSAQNQDFNQQMANAGLNNSAQGQLFSQGLANANLYNTGQQNQFAQGQQNLQNYNAGQDQSFAQGQANAQLNNQNQSTMFNQGLASNQFTNQSIAQQIQQADYFKNQPLNMLNALRSGNQVQMPTFGNVTGGANIAAAPVYAATTDAANYANQQYQQQMGLYGAGLSAVSGLGSAAIKASDRRVKENIAKIGMTKSGLGVYSYNYIWDQKPQIGYMADEVAEIFPEAVLYTPDGYAAVNYGMVR